MGREAKGDPPAVRVGLAVYCCLVRLYPHAFRKRFADELEEDFSAMSRDAWTGGGAVALVRWWYDGAIDLMRSLAREWLATPWIPVSIVSVLIAAGVFWASVGRAQLPLRAFRSRVVPGAPPPADSPALLLLMGLMVLIPVCGVLHELDEAALIRILTEPKNALIKQYQKKFEYDNVKLRFTDDALKAIAHQAVERKVGARGLMMIMEELLLDAMYTLPSQKRVKEFAITREMVERRRALPGELLAGVDEAA